MIVWTSCIISMRSDQTSRKSLCQVTWYAEGTSFIKDGIRYEGAAVTTEEAVIWAEALPPETLSQKPKLLALTKALQLEKGKDLISIPIAGMSLLQYMWQEVGVVDCRKKDYCKQIRDFRPFRGHMTAPKT